MCLLNVTLDDVDVALVARFSKIRSLIKIAW